MRSKLSFLIVNYFSANYTIKLCESIYKFITRYEFQVLIADNSCNEEEKTKLKKLVSDTTKVFFLEENLGFVKANNFLSEKAAGDIFVLINPDTCLIDNSLEKLVEFLANTNDAAIGGPYLLNDDFSYQVSFQNFPTVFTIIKELILLYRKNPYTDLAKLDSFRKCDVVKGACLVIKKKIVDEIGLFDPDFIMYFEEVDLCLRASKYNKSVYYFPSAKIIHYGEKSSSQKRFSDYSSFNYYRSYLLFSKKHFPKPKFILIKFLIYFSLFERTILLLIKGKNENSKLLYRTLKKVIKIKF